MRKGQKKRVWTPEQKAEIVYKHLNDHAALHVSKNLSELERLRLMVAKLEIENERLKKGYWVEGVGANKVFVTEPDKSTKSSKH